MTDPTLDRDASSEQITTLGELTLVIFRGFGAYVVLAACALGIARYAPFDLSAIDAIYWCTLLLLIGLDLRAGKRADAARSPMRLVVTRVVVATVVWLGAHSLHM